MLSFHAHESRLASEKYVFRHSSPVLSPRQTEALQRQAPRSILDPTSFPSFTRSTVQPSPPVQAYLHPEDAHFPPPPNDLLPQREAVADVPPRSVPIVARQSSPQRGGKASPTAERERLPLKEDYGRFVAQPPSSKAFGDFPEFRNPALYRPNERGFSFYQGPAAQGETPRETPVPRDLVKENLDPEISFPYQPREAEEAQPNATMETKVAGAGQPKRVGRWTLSQLRQTDGIIPSQAGWNKGDSQKRMTNFGTPRNTQLNIKSTVLQEVPEEIAQRTHGELRLQSGTNKFASQKGMTNFGTGRDVCREGKYVNQLPADLQELPEEKIRLSDGIVRLQAGTNKYASQKQMMSFGTSRRETTKMIDTKHPEYDHEKPDQSQIPLQSGTNKFASQKNMMSFGTSRRETTRIVDTNHPEYDPESSIDSSTIPSQMGSNKYASQKGMTSFGQGRWEVLDPSISWQNRKSQGMVRLQSGTNRFASQAGMRNFGTIRNTTYEAEAGELPYEDMKKSETIIPSQAGWNRGDSQKGYTSFGAPRDVKGKHLKRIWELEYPEEAEISLDRL